MALGLHPDKPQKEIEEAVLKVESEIYKKSEHKFTFTGLCASKIGSLKRLKSIFRILPKVFYIYI